MISLRRSEIPVYLTSSELFRALNDDDDEMITVPAANIKFDTTVKNDDDATHLLSTLRYWCLSDIVPDLVKYSVTGTGSSSVFLPFAAAFPYTRVLLTLQRDSSPIDRIFAAICFGEVIIVQCLVEEGYILPDNACVVATAANQLQMLRYLHQKEGCKCSLEASLMAARSGNLDCLKYLLEAGFVGLEVCVMAAANGNLECLRWAHTHGCELSTSMMLPAVENDHYDCFVYCYENGHEHTWLTGIILECIERGRTNMFMYAVDQGYPLNNISVAASCASHRRLDMLAYAHKRGMPLPSGLLSSAAEFGSLDIIEYAHEHGCAWYSAVCYNAAQAGELECLRYAVENGCPYDHYGLCDAAVSSNSKEVLRYAEGLPPYDGPEEVGF
jgi:hypothetical protein